MARVSKAYDFHVRLDERDGERFLSLSDRLAFGKADIAREAISLYLAVADAAPPELSRHKLAAWIEDALSAIPLAVGTAPPMTIASLPLVAKNGHPQPAPTPAEPTRADPRRKSPKR